MPSSHTVHPHDRPGALTGTAACVWRKATSPRRAPTSDTGIDGQIPVDLDGLDLICIDPLPSTSGTRTWPTSPIRSATSEPGGDWRGLSRARAPSAGSKTSCMRSIRNCCLRGTPSATPVSTAARSGGSPTTRSSTTMRPRASSLPLSSGWAVRQAPAGGGVGVWRYRPPSPSAWPTAVIPAVSAKAKLKITSSAPASM